MAERRMFAKSIIDSDAFLDMPMSSQALYFHLSMRADDDGFINNPKKIMRMIGASQDDYGLLIAKKFIIHLPNGICVIKHWKIHNYIQKDRYKETVYKEEKSLLKLKDNGVYSLDTECIDNVSSMDTQVRLGKDRLELGNKDIVEQSSVEYPYKAVIDYLNIKAGTAFKDKSKDSRKHIKARFDEGFTLEDFKTVIDKKVNEWSGDSIMAQYLRPSTLFGTKFEGYLNQKTVKKKNDNQFNNFNQRDTDYNALVMDRMKQRLGLTDLEEDE